LDKPAKRKKKCPHCKEYIFVRDEKMVTEEEAKALDWILKLEGYGITKHTFYQEQRNLKAQFNQTPSTNDVIWRILNNMVVNDDPIGYHFMAMIAKDEGKDTKPYITEAMKQTLNGLKNNGLIRNVRILCVNDDHVCDSCRELHNKVMSIEDALATLPIPTKCTNDMCRCYYQHIVSEDAFREELRKSLLKGN